MEIVALMTNNNVDPKFVIKYKNEYLFRFPRKGKNQKTYALSVGQVSCMLSEAKFGLFSEQDAFYRLVKNFNSWENLTSTDLYESILLDLTQDFITR